MTILKIHGQASFEPDHYITVSEDGGRFAYGIQDEADPDDWEAIGFANSLPELLLKVPLHERRIFCSMIEAGVTEDVYFRHPIVEE